MNQPHRLGKILSGLLLLLALVPALTADYPPPQEHEWRIPNFTFKSGETLPELRLHYTTLGEPQNEAVLILHGTTGSARSMFKDGFADELFGAGQPPNFHLTYLFFTTATNGGDQALYKTGMTREKADAYLQERLAAPFKGDANDYIYQWEASRNYNPAPKLDNIRTTVLAINAADDERNPRALGIMEREMPRVKNGREIVIPADETTRGHGTVMQAKRWKDALAETLQNSPRL